ncbi:GNAT family N-acetyltransferase [Acidisphaera sp. L21]|uniref:GNAT family N-acetyltransferase n=1 Tax=Acidisphaera sp. L21 TaxID=1641851 RepID=UPI00131E9DBD|nr:GNAT family N-acetyltransferase [Acidisphaera sp. L21]
MERPPANPAVALPPDTNLVRVTRPTIAFYRFLYDTVGAPHLWWLRRAMPDSALEGILQDPAVGIHVLYRGGEPAGFFELDGRARPDVNLSYFGLMPNAVGRGLGGPFLRAAVDQAFSMTTRGVTVNTCTADHPRALPTYLRTGFRPIRSVREIWDVPTRLGMSIPDHLRV